MAKENQKTDMPPLDDEFIIKDLDTLKVVSDPMRIQILESMIEGPRTVKQIAAELNTTPTKLYYHINMLEERGLIRVTSTRVVSGIIEKHYYLTARSYRPDDSLFSPAGGAPGEGLEMMVNTVLDHTKLELRRSIQAGLIKATPQEQGDKKHRGFALLRNLHRMSEDQAREFTTRFQALVEEFCSEESDNPEEKIYGMLLVFYPTTLRALPPETNKEQDNG